MRTRIFLLKASCILLSAFLICGNTAPLAFCQQMVASISISQPEFITGLEMALHYKKEVIINIIQPVKPQTQKSLETPSEVSVNQAISQIASTAKNPSLLVDVPVPAINKDPADSIRAEVTKNADIPADQPTAIDNKEPAPDVVDTKPISVPSKGTTIITINETHPSFNDPASLIEEMTDPVIGKYADMISVEPSDISNYPLYRFIDKWYGTRYKWGGKSLKGIDCSAFSQKLYGQVYNTDLMRTSKEQHKHCDRFKNIDEASEGDLIFFRINRIRISHVGVYLANGYFVHASRKQGVMISNLDNKYWHRRYAGCGRVERTEDTPAESDFTP
ncbi:MAG: hypothetical protein K0Q79_559 [Flavipsychrobacter sp.]|nr:hypothetical protein [Flavipsychrobacter sp.]